MVALAPLTRLAIVVQRFFALEEAEVGRAGGRRFPHPLLPVKGAIALARALFETSNVTWRIAVDCRDIIIKHISFVDAKNFEDENRFCRRKITHVAFQRLLPHSILWYCLS